MWSQTEHPSKPRSPPALISESQARHTSLLLLPPLDSLTSPMSTTLSAISLPALITQPAPTTRRLHTPTMRSIGSSVHQPQVSLPLLHTHGAIRTTPSATSPVLPPPLSPPTHTQVRDMQTRTHRLASAGWYYGHVQHSKQSYCGADFLMRHVISAAPFQGVAFIVFICCNII